MSPQRTESQLNELIRRVWHRLTDSEIKAREEERDVFFLAVRRKHGVARAEAQLFLNELERSTAQTA